MSVGDTYEIALRWEQLDGTLALMNVWHFRQESAIVQPTASRDLNTAVRQGAIPTLLPVVPNAFRTQTANIFNIDNPTEGEVVTGAFLTGTATGDVIPMQTGPLVHWLTGFRGRSYRGRSFLPPTVEASVLSQGVIEPTALTIYADFAADLINIPATGTHGEWQLMVYSPTLNIKTVVTSFEVRGTVATLNRRQLEA